jgi:DNA primase
MAPRSAGSQELEPSGYPDFKEALKQQADIVRIIGDYVRLKKAGAQNFTGLCPFHKEKTPSFSVHATRQYYYCFGCHEKGDVFTFVQKVENISFPEAVRLVAQKLGIPMPKATYSSEGEAREARLRGQLLDIHQRAVAFFQECLRRPEGARAREYLKGRGLDDATISKFRIGYAPDSGFLLRDRLKGEFSEEVLRDSGLFSWKQDETTKHEGAPSKPGFGLGGEVVDEPDARRLAPDAVAPPPVIPSEARSPASERPAAVEGPAVSEPRGSGPTTQDSVLGTRNSVLRTRDSSALYSKFRNRVMFPISNESAKVIAFTGRTLSTDEKAGPKYLNSPETPIYSKGKVLFNLDLAKEAIRALNYAILVEGQMDCISVFAAGFHNVIASSGTAFTELQAKLLGRFSKRVVVNFDPDTAGAKATERTLGLLVEEEFDIQVLRLEEGFDPDLYVRRKGKDAYAEALKHSQKYFDYLIERARQQFPVRSAEGKDKAVKYLLPHVQRIPSRIMRDELAQEIAQKLGIDSPVLRQELRHVAVTRSSSTIKAQVESQVTDAEKILIRALASGHDVRVGADAACPEPSRRVRPAREASVKDGEFDPARQAAYILETEGLHRGLTTESLAESLLNASSEIADVLEIPAEEGDRRLLASILLKEEEELTADILEAAVRALRRIHLWRRQEQVQRELKAPGLASDKDRLKALLAELEQVSRALRDPGAAGVSRIA